MATLKESLTFDDVTLVPQFSSILPSEASIETSLGRNLQLKIPFLSSAMDTCLLYTSPSPRDGLLSRMPSSA